jgi:predicted ATPase/DNA-binding CsgD family transcriptional regulator
MTVQQSEHPHMLPLQLTSFVGRDEDRVHARALLQRTRLLTLTGPGGSGKTRLALAIMEDVQPGFADGVVVSLAPITDPELVPSAIAEALRFALSRDRPPAKQLVDTFNDRGALLLLLDNFEQVSSAAPLVNELLAGCPRLTVLVTSRAPLRLSGEQVFPVPPLPMPDERDRLAVDEIMRYPAVTLFVMRAQALDPSFRVTDGNARGVVEVCRRLDGLPLAIELAAARVGVFSPRELADRIQQQLPVLARGPRDAPPRQQTIHDAIAWSYDLLTEDQQGLFACLSVFAGGWTLDAAESIAGDTTFDEVETLAALIDHSLINVSIHPDGSTRYGMLETIREFGMRRLAESGRDAETFARHAAYFTDLAERAERASNTPDQLIWLRRLATEIHNIRVALAWSLDHDPVVALRLAGALGMFWVTHGLMREGGDWLESSLARGAAAPPAIRAKALRRAGDLACWQGEYELAARRLEDTLSIYREIGDEAGIGITLFGLARTAQFSGNFEPALSLYEQTIQLQRKLGNWYAVAGATGNRGMMYSRHGDLERAQQQVETALQLSREHGYPIQVAIWARDLGELLLRLNGDRSRARSLIFEALQIDAESSPLRIPENLDVVALLALAEGQPDRAARLHGAAHRLRTLTGFPRSREECQDFEVDVAAIRSALGQDAFDAAWKAGGAMTVEEAIAEALREPDALQPETTGVMTHLTNREREVLRLIAEGFSDKEVAERLSISPYTAMRHVANILNKLGLPSRTAAATFAVRNGLI